ncbi:MAG: BamA/TamA family outer membrane protein [Bryobacteraceae bacterium]
MKWVWSHLLIGTLLLAGEPPQENNVNSRYIIEKVDLMVAGPQKVEIAPPVRSEIQRLTGSHFSQTAIDALIKVIRQQFQDSSITQKLTRGSIPDHVKVSLEVEPREPRFSLSVPKFLYHSKQGWSAAVEGSARLAKNKFTLGLIADGDELAERYAGITGRYERSRLGTDRLRLGFAAGSLHTQWNPATLERLDSLAEAGTPTPGIYRTRQYFEPALTIVLAKPLTFTVGTSFQLFQTQFPAARTEASNALVNTLRYHREWEAPDASKHTVEAGYTLRAATRLLDSDFAYSGHRWQLAYQYARGRHAVRTEFTAGVLNGTAPLFERYYLGTSSTLRGWNKFDIDPVGGDRMVHNTLEYRYRYFQIFYDTGAVWTNRSPSQAQPVPRHSAGVGLRKDNFTLAVAFPIKEGRAEPLFMVGMNY